MKKKKLIQIVGTILVLVLIALTVQYIRLSENYNWQINNANIEFKSSLSLAAAGFAIDYSSKGDENNKFYMYNEAMSNLLSASLLSEFTTYSKQNKEIHLALYNLYKLMEDASYKEIIMQKSNAIYDSVSKLSQNPLDENTTESIIELTKEITQK